MSINQERTPMINKEQFEIIYKNLKVNPKLNKEFIYDCFCYANQGADELIKKNIFGKAVPLNPVVLTLYIINEYGYILDLSNFAVKEDEELMSQVVSIALDKYFTNEHLNFKNEAEVSKYSPQISTLETYLNFALNVLSKSSKKDPRQSLIYDVLYKGFSMCKAIVDLITNGFSTEAFSTWRTLHETECVLLLLTKYGDKTLEEYRKHIRYMMAFRGIIPNKEEVDEIFVQIKDEMKKLDLKSKDMKKFIEYGWLISIPDYNADPLFKFNFRDGVEKLAGLASYSKSYEMASEIAHSSPILIYSKDSFFYKITLLNLYESFFRIENIFADLFVKNANEEEKSRFVAMKKVYYTNLKVIYQREKEIFRKLK